MGGVMAKKMMADRYSKGMPKDSLPKPEEASLVKPPQKNPEQSWRSEDKKRSPKKCSRPENHKTGERLPFPNHLPGSDFRRHQTP